MDPLRSRGCRVLNLQPSGPLRLVTTLDAGDAAIIRPHCSPGVPPMRCPVSGNG